MIRLKASSIYYALFMSIVIALFLGGMILFSSVNRQFASQMDTQDRMIENAYSGIAYGMANYKELDNGLAIELDLFDQGIDSVEITKKSWGAFSIISSLAHHKKSKYSKVALSGQVNDADSPNLYLVDQGRPFSITGTTRIEGKCVIPKAGVKRAYIEGKNYQGDKMIYGTTSVSERSLPKINTNFVADLFDFGGEIRAWEPKDSIEVPFAENAVHFINDGYIKLENTIISGQVVIEAKDSIYVAASALLDQVILKSEVIYVERGFVGTAQLFASKRIVLEEDVLLKYPSVIGLLEEEQATEKNAEIIIGEGSHVIGSVFAISEESNFRLPVQISIEKEAEVDGLLYCQGRTQLKGTVNGSLYTQKFYLETAASKYENHLLDAQILNDLPTDFVYISLFDYDNPLTQIQWLK